MLILPPGHAETLRAPRSFQPREKVMLSGVLAVLAALLVVLVLSVGSGESHSGRGCISVGLAYATGGETINRCGEAARAMCAEVNQPGAPGGAGAHAMSTECRKAGLATGATP